MVRQKPIFVCPYCKAIYHKQTWRCGCCKTEMIMLGATWVDVDHRDGIMDYELRRIRRRK